MFYSAGGGHVRPKQSGSAWTVSTVHGASAGPYRRGGTGYGRGATTTSAASSSLATFSVASASFLLFVRDHSRTEPACLNCTPPGSAGSSSSATCPGAPTARLGRAPARQRNRADENEAAELEGAERLAATAQKPNPIAFDPEKNYAGAADPNKKHRLLVLPLLLLQTLLLRPLLVRQIRKDIKGGVGGRV